MAVPLLRPSFSNFSSRPTNETQEWQDNSAMEEQGSDELGEPAIPPTTFFAPPTGIIIDLTLDDDAPVIDLASASDDEAIPPPPRPPDLNLRLSKRNMAVHSDESVQTISSQLIRHQMQLRPRSHVAGYSNESVQANCSLLNGHHMQLRSRSHMTLKSSFAPSVVVQSEESATSVPTIRGIPTPAWRIRPNARVRHALPPFKMPPVAPPDDDNLPPSTFEPARTVTLTLYTDGSFRNNGMGGAGIAYLHNGAWYGRALALGRIETSYVAEMEAIRQGLSMARAIVPRIGATEVVIQTDHEGAMTLLNDGALTLLNEGAMTLLKEGPAKSQHGKRISQLAAQTLHERKQLLCEDRGVKQVKFWWCKGHSLNAGNDRADILAAYGANKSTEGKENWGLVYDNPGDLDHALARADRMAREDERELVLVGATVAARHSSALRRAARRAAKRLARREARNGR